jgi:hypothetical protein
MGLLRRTFPLSRTAVALWGWHHRHEITHWVSYAMHSAPRLLAGDTADVLLEGRLRARLTADGRTRNVDGLHVYIDNGVVHLTGMVKRDVHEAALAIATNTSGVHRVADKLTEPRDQRRKVKA